MKKAFTLIELLVVMIILVTIMSLVVPKGAKLLKIVENKINSLKENQNIIKLEAESFFKHKEQNITILNKNFFINDKGLVIVVN